MTYTSQQSEVRDWLARREAILLAHNYQPAEIQDVADLTGDSLALSVTASTTAAKIIIFAGVHFMAETAAILCPDKTVLLPRLDAGCYMAETITPASLKARKAELPRGAGGGLCQLQRRGQGGQRHLLHLCQRRQGGQFPPRRQGAHGAG